MICLYPIKPRFDLNRRFCLNSAIADTRFCTSHRKRIVREFIEGSSFEMLAEKYNCMYADIETAIRYECVKQDKAEA